MLAVTLAMWKLNVMNFLKNIKLIKMIERK